MFEFNSIYRIMILRNSQPNTRQRDERDQADHLAYALFIVSVTTFSLTKRVFRFSFACLVSYFHTLRKIHVLSLRVGIIIIYLCCYCFCLIVACFLVKKIFTAFMCMCGSNDLSSYDVQIEIMC